MSSIRLDTFAGMTPRISKRLLPQNAATTARNVKLTSGELRSFHSPRTVVDLSSEPFTVRRAYRVLYADMYGDLLDQWLAFDSRDVDVLRSPIVNDEYNRLYWFNDGRPKYNPLSRISDGQDPLLLGVPGPTLYPTLSFTVGSDFTRSYVYTFVSAYGEESQPSPPVTGTGAAGTWTLGNMQTTVDDAAQRNITRKRIYRTVVGNSSTLFFLVDEVPLATVSYDDDIDDDVVALNNQMESTSWTVPPSDLEGAVLMPNGYMVGWTGRRLCFSEPYRPHAWPAEYELSTEFEITGLAVYGSTLVIGTKSNPYIGQGVTPASFTMQKLDAIEPCLSRRGMASTVAGVYYPSPNGIVLVNTQGTAVVTQDLMTREDWAKYNPSDLYAAAYGLRYVAFNSPDFGMMFDPTEQLGRWIELDRFKSVEGIETDRYTGDLHLIRNGRVERFDPEDTQRLFWRWKSKEFHLPKHTNFGAAKIKFDTENRDITVHIVEVYGDYNAARWTAGPLNTLNGHALHGVQGAGLVEGWVEPENRMPLSGDLLYPIRRLADERASLRFIAYAGGVKVLDTNVYAETMIRLPAGFKRDVWQFELIANTNVFSLQVAETGKELAQV